MFEEEISPEELFRQFFGGGAFGGGPMGGFGGTYSSPLPHNSNTDVYM